MQNKKVAMSENGIGWIKNHALHWMGTLTFDPNNSNRVFATSGNGVFMTSNLSAPVSMWNFQAHGIEETVPGDLVSLAGGPMVSVILDYDGFRHDDIYSYPSAKHSPPMGSTTGLAAASANIAKVARVSGDLYVSSDTARTWSKWNKPTVEKGGKLAFSTDGNTLLWAPNSGLVYRTENQGLTWTNSSGLTGQSIPLADGFSPQKFYAYKRRTGEFFISDDKGKNFRKKSGILLS